MDRPGLLVESHKVEGTYVLIPIPDLLPLYDLATYVYFENGEETAGGEVIGIKITAAMDPHTREFYNEILYTVLCAKSNIEFEVPEDDITAAYDETNSLSSAHYDDEEGDK